MRGADDKYEFEGDVEAVTGKAILFHGDYWEEEKKIWVARSVASIDFDADDPTRATVLLPGWLVRREGLDEDEGN